MGQDVVVVMEAEEAGDVEVRKDSRRAMSTFDLPLSPQKWSNLKKSISRQRGCYHFTNL